MHFLKKLDKITKLHFQLFRQLLPNFVFLSQVFVDVICHEHSDTRSAREIVFLDDDFVGH